MRPLQVELFRPGRKIADLARELGCSERVILRWLKQAYVEYCGDAGLSKTERADLKRLRRENKRLTRQRDLLLTAGAYLSITEGDRIQRDVAKSR
jgi:transposase-like protein